MRRCTKREIKGSWQARDVGFLNKEGVIKSKNSNPLKWIAWAAVVGLAVIVLTAYSGAGLNDPICEVFVNINAFLRNLFTW